MEFNWIAAYRMPAHADWIEVGTYSSANAAHDAVVAAKERGSQSSETPGIWIIAPAECVSLQLLCSHRDRPRRRRSDVRPADPPRDARWRTVRVSGSRWTI